MNSSDSRPAPSLNGRRWPTRRAGINPAKDRTITRLACLKAAAEFGASRPDAKSTDVLKIAEKWEAWVNR